MPDDPLASLSPAQRDSFETFTAFTARDASAPDEARKSVELLRDAGWDVQVRPIRLWCSVIQLSMCDGDEEGRDEDTGWGGATCGTVQASRGVV